MGAVMRALLMNHWDRTGRRDAVLRASLPCVDGVETVEGIQVGEHPMQTLNLYLPKRAPEDGGKPLPCLVYIHGGGWMYGEPGMNGCFCATLAARGWAVASLGYRLLPEADLRGQAQDLFAALGWLVDNGAGYGIDTGALCLAGDSAGAHLAGLVTCLGLSQPLRRRYNVPAPRWRVAAVGMIHGVCIPEKMEMTRFGPTSVLARRELFRMMFGPVPRIASWYGHAAFIETAVGLALPPIFLVSSEADRFHPQTMTVDAWLTAHGQPHELVYWTLENGPKLGHVFNVAFPHWPESVRTNKAMLRYFRKALG